MATSYFERTSSPSTNSGGNSILSPSTPTTAPPRTNALQNRITTLLSASYADLEIRDSLALLDTRHIQNSATTRRNLRLDVQQELIECNGDIVRDFGRVAEQLQRVGVAIGKLNASCAEMRRHVGAAKRETGPMLDDARTLTRERTEVEGKQELLDAFKKHFVLSDADQAVLTSTAETVNNEFFRILTRVKKIHQDSQVLLGYENQRLGLEILEQSSRQLNAAFQKLYRWVQREFKSLDLENPQISTAIRRALRVLAERPTLFQNCLDFFAEARENILSNNFYAALTGRPDENDHPVMGKAIELSAHDPLRYVSDMLAWAHSATVSEREALEALFVSDGDEIAKSIQAGIESEAWIRAGDSDQDLVFDGRKALNQLVDRDLTGVFRQLRQRTEQVVHSHEDAPLAYKISNLITFYTTIFAALVGPDSALLSALHPLADTALRAFKTITRDQVTALHADNTTSMPPTTLQPPDFLLAALDTLKALMKSYDTSVLLTSTPAERAQGFQPILTEALEPFLAGTENLSRRMRAPDKDILAINSLLAVRETLAQYTFADRSADLTPRLQQHEQALEGTTFASFLKESQLQILVDTVKSPKDLAHFYSNPATLSRIAQGLDAFLPSAADEARAFLAQLQDRKVLERVVGAAAERFVEVCEWVEGIIEEADGEQYGGQGDEDEGGRLGDIWVRTGDEIRVLVM